jgi:hypothetical protein
LPVPGLGMAMVRPVSANALAVCVCGNTPPFCPNPDSCCTKGCSCSGSIFFNGEGELLRALACRQRRTM